MRMMVQTEVMMDSFIRCKYDSIVQALRAAELHSYGSPCARSHVGGYVRSKFLNTCQYWKVYKTASPFTRRVTCVRWHPRYPDIVAFSAHSGDILLWHYDRPTERDPMIKGVGMGYGCITEMKFHPDTPSRMYTSSVDGRFCLQDFEGRKSEVYLDTMDIEYWWCSFDYSRVYDVIVVGDNRGSAAFLNSNGQSIGKCKRLHKGKIKHVEFCPLQPWTMATASVDRTVALWDIRFLRDRVVKGMLLTKSTKPMTTIEHGGPVASCYFDPLHGSRLLTTAHNDEIRVYDSHNLWEEPTITVSHPHRHFQHMTDIKATWHPLYADVCVVGRYPRKEDLDQTRSVDLIDLVSGRRAGQFYSPHLSNIIQVNQFNRTGDCLASGMGYNTLLWKAPSDQQTILRAAREEARSKEQRSVPLPHRSQTNGEQRALGRGTKRKRPQGDDKEKKKKMKTLVNSQTSQRRSKRK